MKKTMIAVWGIILLLLSTSNIFAQIADIKPSLKTDTFPHRDTIKSKQMMGMQETQLQKQREEYNRERQKLERERERLDRERERLNRQRDSLDRKYASVVSTERKKPSFGERIDSTAKVVGHKGAELGAKAAAGIKDRSLQNVKGPHGETVYVDKYDRRYYINKEGKRIYLKGPKSK